MRALAIVLACGFAVSESIADPAPGTSVNLTPPAGFVKASRFAGFMKEATSSSIMVTEIPGPYAKVTGGFSDQKRMQAQGMKLLNKSPVEVDGHTAMLLDVEQSAYGTLFRKWILAVDGSGSTTLIVASYPSTEAKQQEEPLKAAVIAATFREKSDPMEALLFTVTPSPPFAITKVMGQTLVL